MHLYLPTQQSNDPRSEVLHTKYSHKIAHNQSPKVVNILIINKFKKITICSKTTQEKKPKTAKQGIHCKLLLCWWSYIT